MFNMWLIMRHLIHYTYKSFFSKVKNTAELIQLQDLTLLKMVLEKKKKKECNIILNLVKIVF